MNLRCLPTVCRQLVFLLAVAPFARGQDAPAPEGSAYTESEASNLAPERVKQALSAEREFLARQPNDPAAYVNLAYTLNDAGMNSEAREVMVKATKVAPNSAFAFNVQAWVLRHNVLGVDFGKGFDYDASVSSYRKAISFDPNDLDLRQSLANLLEFNRNGIRYAADAKLTEAIELYRYVKARQRVVTNEVEDNLVIDLFYAGLFSDLFSEFSTTHTSPVQDGVRVAALAASKGVPEAVAFANQIGGDEQRQKDALSFAAEGLWNIRLYPQAADILTASLPDPTNSRAVISKIQIFRDLKPYKGADLPSSDPRSPVQRLIAGGMTNTLTQDLMKECVSRHPFSSESEWKQEVLRLASVPGRFRTLSRQTGLPEVVIEDIVLGSMKITIVPSPGPGARVLVQFPGLLSQSFFVLQEGGSFKVVAMDRGLGEIGLESIYLLHEGKDAEAKALLDWKRELIDRNEGDDPLGGLLFARIWTSNRTKGPQDIELAAAALLSRGTDLLPLLPAVLKARGSTSVDEDRDNLDLLLASIYLHTGDGPRAQEVAQQLLKQHSQSDTALGLVGRSYGLQKKWDEWRSLVDNALQSRPSDRDLLIQTASEAEAESNFSGARRSYRTILDSGHASAEDFNMYAWLSLFEGNVDDQALAAAEQANLLTAEGSFANLHTLACLEAARGRTAEARQLLLQAMSVGGLEEPDSSIWLGFGQIYEQYGVIDAAASAYKRVEASKGVTSPTDTFVLAQARLRALPVR